MSGTGSERPSDRETTIRRLRRRFGIADGQRNDVTDWLQDRGAIPMAVAAAVLGVFLLVKVIGGFAGGL